MLTDKNEEEVEIGMSVRVKEESRMHPEIMIVVKYCGEIAFWDSASFCHVPTDIFEWIEIVK